MKIGFIGIGIMGKPMAKNILKNGYELIVCDKNEESVAELIREGAKSVENGRELAKQCNVILTMLPNSPHVTAVVLGENGIIDSVQPGSTLIDMSSINPIDSKRIAAELAKKGVRMLDAPVSGGEPKAIDGTLAFMVGGDKAVFDEFKPLLDTMGSSVVLCGEIGAGNTTKLVNQIIVAMNITAVSEAFMLAKKSGVNPEVVYEAIKGGLAGSTVMNAKIPMILESNYKPGFKIDLHIKDLNNALEAAHAVGAPLPFTASIMEILINLKEDGQGQCDHSAIAKYYEKLTGTTIGFD